MDIHWCNDKPKSKKLFKLSKENHGNRNKLKQNWQALNWWPNCNKFNAKHLLLAQHVVATELSGWIEKRFIAPWELWKTRWRTNNPNSRNRSMFRPCFDMNSDFGDITIHVLMNLQTRITDDIQTLSSTSLPQKHFLTLKQQMHHNDDKSIWVLNKYDSKEFKCKTANAIIICSCRRFVEAIHNKNRALWVRWTECQPKAPRTKT